MSTFNGAVPMKRLPTDQRMRFFDVSLHYESCCRWMHRGVITCGLVAASRPECWTPRSFFTASRLALDSPPKKCRLLLPALLSPPTPKVAQDNFPRHPFNTSYISIFVETMPQAIAEC